MADVITTIVKSAAALPGTKSPGRDWGSWGVGLWSAFIVGATSSVGTGLLGPVVGIQGLKNYFILTGGTFFLTGFVNLMAYLHNHPAPEPYSGVERRQNP